MGLRQQKIKIIECIIPVISALNSVDITNLARDTAKTKKEFRESAISIVLETSIAEHQEPEGELLAFHQLISFMAKEYSQHSNLFTKIAVGEVFNEFECIGSTLVHWLELHTMWSELTFSNTEDSLNEFFHQDKFIKADRFEWAMIALTDGTLPPEAAAAYAYANRVDMKLIKQGKAPKFMLRPSMNKGGRPKSTEAITNTREIALRARQKGISIAASCRDLEYELGKTAKQLEAQYRRTINSNPDVNKMF